MHEVVSLNIKNAVEESLKIKELVFKEGFSRKVF